MRWTDWLDSSGIFLSKACPLPLDAPFTPAQAHDWGVSRAVLGRLHERGLVRRVVLGVYAASQCPDSVATRAQALHLVLPQHGVICDQTAAWLHGIPILKRGSHLRAPPLDTCSTKDTRVERPGVDGKRRFTLTEKDVEELHGLRVTSALRTATDLGRRLWKYDALAALDGALRIGVDLDELVGEIKRFKGQRGVRQLRALAPLADGRAESPGESALRLRWHEAELPWPEPQYEITNSRGVLVYRLDVPLPELRFGAEYDGEEFHPEDNPQPDIARRQDLWDNWGWDVRGFRKNDVYDPRSDLDVRLNEMFYEARRRYRRWSP